MFKFYSKEIIKYVLIIAIVILILFPLYYLIVLALTSNSFITSGIASLTPDGANWENFSEVVDQKFLDAFGLSIAVLVSLVLVRLLIYTLAAFGLNNVTNLTRKAFIIILIFISLVPDITIYLSLKTFANQFNLINFPFIFSLMINGFFSFFLINYLYSAVKNISDKKIKLAKMDNLKWYESFAYVYFPSIKFAWFLIAVFTSVQSWNDYLWPRFVLSSFDNQTISIWFLSLGDTGFSKLINLQAAGSVIATIIPLGIYLIFSKKINKAISGR
ncbi:hypothetical protein ACA758_00630 [Mycoplasmopsis agassizii]|uniref:hypothetical protein n=1 Tax=Mycoplasmopsis agassizii TaxID=33922 RepID=UPI003528396D